MDGHKDGRTFFWQKMVHWMDLDGIQLDTGRIRMTRGGRVVCDYKITASEGGQFLTFCSLARLRNILMEWVDVVLACITWFLSLSLHWVSDSSSDEFWCHSFFHSDPDSGLARDSSSNFLLLFSSLNSSINIGTKDQMRKMLREEQSQDNSGICQPMDHHDGGHDISLSLSYCEFKVFDGSLERRHHLRDHHPMKRIMITTMMIHPLISLLCTLLVLYPRSGGRVGSLSLFHAKRGIDMKQYDDVRYDDSNTFCRWWSSRSECHAMIHKRGRRRYLSLCCILLLLCYSGSYIDRWLTYKLYLYIVIQDAGFRLLEKIEIKTEQHTARDRPGAKNPPSCLRLALCVPSRSMVPEPNETPTRKTDRRRPDMMRVKRFSSTQSSSKSWSWVG